MLGVDFTLRFHPPFPHTLKGSAMSGGLKDDTVNPRAITATLSKPTPKGKAFALLVRPRRRRPGGRRFVRGLAASSVPAARQSCPSPVRAGGPYPGGSGHGQRGRASPEPWPGRRPPSPATKWAFAPHRPQVPARARP